MDHIAIMKKSWKLIPKILSCEKTIESRWYMARYPPWNRINAGDTIYFKDSGESVTAKAQVERVEQYENYSEKELKKIFQKYSKGVCFVTPLDETFDWAKKRKYCILLFLRNPQRVKNFHINKKGFGNAAAWLCVGDIEKIKRKES